MTLSWGGGILKQSALLIVDRDFNATHVGVRRVIQHYWSEFSKLGYSIEFGTFVDGILVGLETKILSSELFQAENKRKNESVFWSKGDPIRELRFSGAHKTARQLRWSKKELNPSDFGVSLVTNPWVLSQPGISKVYKFDFGIVLDMVPNLISLGTLVFEKWVDAFSFAVEHREGYEYMTKNIGRVLTISDSTKSDFVKLTNYPSSRVTTIIPFDSLGFVVDQTHRRERALRVVMVNALDHRKNFSSAGKALAIAGERVPIELTIIGRERVASHELEDFLKLAESSCTSVVWFREADDEKLKAALGNSDILFFPSKYEGLGLPILEAQAMGVPVLSDKVSSCGEFNVNSALALLAATAEEYAEALVAFFDNNISALKGHQLAKRQEELLGQYANLSSLLDAEITFERENIE